LRSHKKQESYKERYRVNLGPCNPGTKCAREQDRKGVLKIASTYRTSKSNGTKGSTEKKKYRTNWGHAKVVNRRPHYDGSAKTLYLAGGVSKCERRARRIRQKKKRNESRVSRKDGANGIESEQCKWKALCEGEERLDILHGVKSEEETGKGSRGVGLYQ